MNENPSSTKRRILDAAEKLFAQHGFAGASLRQVTSEAQVNLAAVNYHFGSKEKLIAEVLRTRLDKLNGDRLEALRKIDHTSASLEAVLSALIDPALSISASGESGSTFVRLLARAYAEQNDQLRRFLHDNYGHVQREFAGALAQALPGLDRQELLWRLDIVIGALTFAMADFGMIKRRGASEDEHRRLVSQHLIKFAAAGLREK